VVAVVRVLGRDAIPRGLRKPGCLVMLRNDTPVCVDAGGARAVDHVVAEYLARGSPLSQVGDAFRFVVVDAYVARDQEPSAITLMAAALGPAELNVVMKLLFGDRWCCGASSGVGIARIFRWMGRIPC